MLSRFILVFLQKHRSISLFSVQCLSDVSSSIKRKHIELAEILDLLNSLYIAKIKFNTKFI